MSTRCQVKITQKNVPLAGPVDLAAVTLYHHCDGYPSNMVPLIARAFQKDWQHGRVEKVASFVVAEDPRGYEIEQGHTLHGDIEWYYVLEVGYESYVEAIPTWDLRVYRVPYDAVRDHRMFPEVYRGTIQDAVPLAVSMEDLDEDELGGN